VNFLCLIVLPKYEIEVNLERCISAGSCYSLDPVHYEMGKNQKSMVKGGKTDDAKSIGEFDDDKISAAQQAAQACPVQAISVTKKE
jgi:ferredoxin